MKTLYKYAFFMLVASCAQQNELHKNAMEPTVNMDQLKGLWNRYAKEHELGYSEWNITLVEINIDTDSTLSIYNRLHEPNMSSNISAKKAATDYYTFRLTGKKPKGYKKTERGIYFELIPLKKKKKKKKYFRLVSLTDSTLTLENENFVTEFHLMEWDAKNR